MTDKQFITRMINGAYLMDRVCWHSLYTYALYADGEIICSVRTKQKDRFHKILKKKKGKYFISIKAVRSLRKNSLAKQLYIKSKSITNEVELFQQPNAPEIKGGG